MTEAPWTSESKGFATQLWKKPITCAFVRSQNGSRTILTEMNCKQIWCRTKSATHSVRIRRKWSTTLAMWSTSNCARPLQKCNAPTAYLIGQKALYIVHVEFACATRKIRFLNNFELRDSERKCLHGARHGKSEEQTYYHQAFNSRKRCRKRKDATNQITQEFHTDFCVIRSTVNHKKKFDGMKQKCPNSELSCSASKLEHSTKQIRKKRSDGHPTRLEHCGCIENHLYRKSEEHQKPSGWRFWTSSSSSTWWQSDQCDYQLYFSSC